jgi:hypothetical protein
MAGFIHKNNFLLELAQISTFGWVKELCYRTLTNGVIDATGIQVVYDLFVSKGAAVSAEPAETPEQGLRLTKLVHEGGVNALKAGSEMAFQGDKGQETFGSWLRVQGHIRFKVQGSRFMIISNNMAYEKKEYKKRIEGCHNL